MLRSHNDHMQLVYTFIQYKLVLVTGCDALMPGRW